MEDKDWRIADPLSEVTRKERRLLLGVSVLAFFMVKAGALPTKVSALGIELGHGDQRVFLFMIFTVVTYLTIVFIVYSSSDFIAWQTAIADYRIKGEKAAYKEGTIYPADQHEAVEQEIENRIYTGYLAIYRRVRLVSNTRAALEFLVPVLVGAFVAVTILMSAFWS